MPETSLLEARLDRLFKLRPELAEAAALQRSVLVECYRLDPTVVAPMLPRERALQKLRDGVPLLHAETFDPDVPFCRDLFGRLVNVLQAYPESAEAAGAIALAAASGRLDFEHALGESLANHSDHLFELGTWAGVPPDALVNALALVAQRPLQGVMEALRPLLELEPWGQRYCPICGGWPGLAEVQLNRRERHLRCLRCGADWAVGRFACAYCGNDDEARLDVLAAEDEPRFRAELCGACQGYLKVAHVFEASPPPGLALEDLASLHLDVAALDRGYQRPARPGFRLELGEEQPDEALEDLLEADW